MTDKQLEQIKAIISENEKNFDFNDHIMNYGDDKDLQECETVREVIDYIRGLNDDGDITRTEVIYYSNAMQYLSENDQSLNESIELAQSFWYDIWSVNSELLASLLKTQNNENDFWTFLDNIEGEIESVLGVI